MIDGFVIDRFYCPGIASAAPNWVDDFNRLDDYVYDVYGYKSDNVNRCNSQDKINAKAQLINSLKEN